MDATRFILDWLAGIVMAVFVVAVVICVLVSLMADDPDTDEAGVHRGP